MTTPKRTRENAALLYWKRTNLPTKFLMEVSTFGIRGKGGTQYPISLGRAQCSRKLGSSGGLEAKELETARE